MGIADLIKEIDLDGLRDMLANDPELANKGIPLGWCGPEAHPLHRICDGVFNGVYSDEQAVEIAKVFLEAGALIDGTDVRITHDTPLVAAASLHAEKTGMFYVDSGADLHHQGCHGGTALHWAAWCGRDKLVKRLLENGGDIHKKCIDHEGTPLLWAVHGYKFGGAENRHNQIECARLLVAAGSDTAAENIEGTRMREFLDESDVEMINVIN